jgi:hypothetical protein
MIVYSLLLLSEYRTLRENLVCCSHGLLNVQLFCVYTKYRTLRRIWGYWLWYCSDSSCLSNTSIGLWGRIWISEWLSCIDCSSSCVTQSIGLWGESELESFHTCIWLMGYVRESIGLWGRIWILILNLHCW